MMGERIPEGSAKEAAPRYWLPAGSPNFIAACLEAGPGMLHLHDEWQFAVADEPATLFVGAYRRCAVGPADVVVIRPYDVHEEAGGSTWRTLYVTDAVMAGIVTDPRHPCLDTPVRPAPGAGAELRNLLRDSENGVGEESAFVPLAMAWLQRLLRQDVGPVRYGPRRPRPAVERMRAYLRDRPTEGVSASEAARAAGVASSHFVRSFSREVGLPPRSYHTQARLALARRLLAEGRSATWVAYECGFADQSHLTRRFKQCYQLTPGTFQAQCGTGLGTEAGFTGMSGCSVHCCRR